MADYEELIREVSREASVMVPAPTPVDPAVLTSRFGQITHAKPNEPWPDCDEGPMWPLLQVVVSELPHVPEVIADLAVIQVFVPEEYIDYSPDSAEVRAYSTADDLVPCESPKLRTTLKPTAVLWSLRHNEIPSSLAEPPAGFSEEAWDECCAKLLREPIKETKVGGWPALIQDEAYFNHYDDQATCDYKYALQVGSQRDLGWMWGDLGCCYIGRDRDAGDHEWSSEWQSH